MARKLQLMRALEIFSSLDPDVLGEVCRSLAVERFAEDAVIIHESNFGDRLYVIESGIVSVHVDGAAGVFPIGKLGEGDSFGELDLLTSTRRRRATVRALTEVVALTLNAQAYERLVGLYPSVRVDLARNVGAFMHARLEAMMQAKSNRVSEILKSPLGF